MRDGYSLQIEINVHSEESPSVQAEENVVLEPVNDVKRDEMS